MALLAHRQTLTWITWIPANWAATRGSDSSRYINAGQGCAQGLCSRACTYVTGESGQWAVGSGQWALGSSSERCHSKAVLKAPAILITPFSLMARNPSLRRWIWKRPEWRPTPALHLIDSVKRRGLAVVCGGCGRWLVTDS